MNPHDLGLMQIERSLVEQLTRMLTHDINGKVMGVDGILTCWESLGVDTPNFREDIGIIRDAFGDMKTEFQLLNWFFQDEVKFAQAISLHHFHLLAQRFLSRFFRPPSSFVWQRDGEDNSIFCTPHQLIFWTSSFCQMLSRVRPQEQPIRLELNSAEQGTLLEMRCHAAFLETFLAGKPVTGLNTAPWEEWFIYFGREGGTCSLNSEATLPISLSIPLSTL